MRIGLAGVGHLGKHHLRHLSEMDGVLLSGVWDSDLAVRSQVHSQHGVPVTDSFSELVEISDAIDIVTPTSTHYELAMEAVHAERPLFIEKPICATYRQGAELVELADKKNVLIQVGHIERFNQAFRALGDTAVNSQFIEAHRLAQWVGRGVDVAVVYDLMIHDIDLILSLARSEPEHIHANGVGVVTDSVDIANARIQFESGLVANITASRISLKQMRKIRIFGKHEYIALDFGKGTCEYVGATQADQPVPNGAMPLGKLGEGERQQHLFRQFLTADKGDAMKLELEAFRDSVVNGTTPPVSGLDGLKALKLAEQIVEATESS